MSICDSLRINTSTFEGYELPETVYDALIFFSTEVIDDNNIPKHIKDLLTMNRENPDMEEEKMIEEAKKHFLMENIKQQLNRNETNNILKIDCIYNILCLCLDDYDTYKMLGQFINVMDYKIREILSVIDNNKNNICYVKARELQDLHIRDLHIRDSLI